MNDPMKSPDRYIIRPKEEVRANQLLAYIGRPTEHEEDKHISPPETTKPEPTKEAGAMSDEVIFADDASMITEQDAIPQISKILNYFTVTTSRNVNIKWER